MKRSVICIILICFSLFGLIGCQKAQDQQPTATPDGSVTSAEPEGPKQPQVPQVIETGSGVTVIYAADWQSQYPDIYASYMKNSENKDYVDHVEEYPMIAVLYEGMAFNKYYNSARGHTYSIEDLTSTGRPHALANCFTCKTPDFTNAANEMGDSAYTMAFEDMLAMINEPISCFNCHANEPGTLIVTHTYLSDAMGDDLTSVPAVNLACAQCHVEYYFDPVTKAVTLPYDSLSAVNPDEILDYFNNLLVEGEPFADYTNPRSGVRQIKVQHPEFETYMGEGSVHAGTFSCADCHMGTATNASGDTFTSHYWTSPLQNKDIMATCAACHTDLAADVKAIQDLAEERTIEIGNSLVDLTEKLVSAVESGTYSEDDLNAVRSLARNAQFYWDFVMVENSEGAHNSKLTYQCLDKAEDLCAQAMKLLDA